MDQSAINEGNALIAEFLGWYKDEHAGDDVYRETSNLWFLEFTHYPIRYMKFNKDWNWIMLAWVKFRELSFDDRSYENEHNEWCSSLSWYMYSAQSPESFFERMTYAIKWYGSICISCVNLIPPPTELNTMTTEQLLNPRYKVIATYPGSKLEIGTILHKYVFPETNNYCWVTNPDVLLYGDNLREDEVEPYEYLFKRLEWWEYREEKDAPEYVKLNPENTRGQKNIFKVTKAVSYPEGDFEIYIDSAEFPGAHAKYFLPATSQEYIDYHKSLKEQ